MIRISKFSVIFLLLVCFNCGCKSDIENNCTWTYKCCEFKQVDGIVKCERMCEALINCENQNNDQVEVFDELKDGKSGDFFFTGRLPIPCRTGFKYVNGRCRMIHKIVPNEN